MFSTASMSIRCCCHGAATERDFATFGNNGRNQNPLHYRRLNGAPGVIRTRDRRIRNPMLYPTELQAQRFILLDLKTDLLA